MVKYLNDFETQKNEIQTKYKIKPQHILLFSYSGSFPDSFSEGRGRLYTIYILCFLFSQLQPRINPVPQLRGL